MGVVRPWRSVRPWPKDSRRGGDVIRFAELYHQVKFPQALTLLHQWRGLAPLLHQATGFHRVQLHRRSEAVEYLYQRGVRSPELIGHMRIGYAHGPETG